MAKGGKGYSGRSGGFSFGKSSSSFSSSTPSYRVAPPPTPKIHNNIFSTRSGSEGLSESQRKSSSPKKVDTTSSSVSSTTHLYQYHLLHLVDFYQVWLMDLVLVLVHP